MKIFKKIWHWLFGKKEVESPEDYKARKTKEAFEKKHSRGEEGTKIKGRVNQAPTPQNPSRDFSRESDEYLRQQVRRNSDDNFMLGAMIGYVVADSLLDNTSHRNVEETKSSNYESNYTPSSSSSYDSGSYSSSYSSSYDSGSSSSSSSCDSGC